MWLRYNLFNKGLCYFERRSIFAPCFKGRVSQAQAPRRTGSARIFLSSWLHLRSVIAGISIWDTTSSNGSNRSSMFGKVLKKYVHRCFKPKVYNYYYYYYYYYYCCYYYYYYYYYYQGLFIVWNLGQSSINGLWNVADNAWRVVRFFVDVEWNVVRLVEWHMCSSRQIERHTKEVYDFFVGLDCDFKAMLAEDITKILLNSFYLTGRGLGYGGPHLPRQNLLSHGKTYFLTAKLTFPRQNLLFTTAKPILFMRE